jgi:hypothetical protein
MLNSRAADDDFFNVGFHEFFEQAQAGWGRSFSFAQERVR